MSTPTICEYISDNMLASSTATKMETVGKLHEKVSALFVDGIISRLDANQLHLFIDTLYLHYLDGLMSAMEVK